MVPYLAISIILICFFAFYLLFYPEERQNLLKNFILYIVVFIFGFAIFFQDGVAATFLENYKGDNLISRADAEIFVSEEFDGVSVLYSWYGFHWYKPVVIVMAQKDLQTRQVIIDAFSGELFVSGFDPKSEIPTVREKLLELERLRIQEEEAKAKAEEAYKWIQNFSWDKVAKAWDSVFMEAYEGVKQI